MHSDELQDIQHPLRQTTPVDWRSGADLVAHVRHELEQDLLAHQVGQEVGSILFSGYLLNLYVVGFYCPLYPQLFGAEMLDSPCTTTE